MSGPRAPLLTPALCELHREWTVALVWNPGARRTSEVRRLIEREVQRCPRCAALAARKPTVEEARYLSRVDCGRLTGDEDLSDMALECDERGWTYHDYRDCRPRLSGTGETALAAYRLAWRAAQQEARP